VKWAVGVGEEEWHVDERNELGHPPTYQIDAVLIFEVDDDGVEGLYRKHEAWGICLKS